jgi:argininosuccinate lyase
MIAAGLAVAIAHEGVSFREAHGLVGSMVAEAQRTNSTLRVVAARVLATKVPAVAKRLDLLFAPDEAVRSKAARGGTAPDAVRVSLDAALGRLRRA